MNILILSNWDWLSAIQSFVSLIYILLFFLNPTYLILTNFIFSGYYLYVHLETVKWHQMMHGFFHLIIEYLWKLQWNFNRKWWRLYLHIKVVLLQLLLTAFVKRSSGKYGIILYMYICKPSPIFYEIKRDVLCYKCN